MTTEVLFYTQIASLVTFVLVVFGVYRLLVQQKDASIELLKQRLEDQSERIRLLELQTPDALASSLSERVEIQLAEIERLRLDSNLNRTEIDGKESELREVQSKLASLLSTIRDSDFLCPHCGAPLSQRSSYDIHGYVDGRDVEATVEHLEYECGLAINHEGEVSPCRRVSGDAPVPMQPSNSLESTR
ncbi:hypothetical protein [Povalibacter sp.]|uniref:hypothetical protein n=1 Tax=Povalibacter sp. TaxID=1962978 RepID=UPI002F3E4B2D